MFYKEANRVLKRNSIIAAWAYGLPTISPGVDEIISRYHYQTIGDYWLPENKYSEQGYATIPFPYPQISTPEFYYRQSMSPDDLLGYLNTWSATQRFIDTNKFNPTAQLRNDLIAAWGDPGSEKIVTWKLMLKVGRV